MKTSRQRKLPLKPDHRIYKALSIIFAILTLVSIVGVYYTHQLPLYKNKITTLCTYRHIGTYDYEASLLPNIIYNVTKLRPREGPLYTAIVDQIDLNFTYSFESIPSPSNITVSQELTIELESPDKWNRTLTEDETGELLQLNVSDVITMSINETKISPIIEWIEEDTGIRSTDYNLNVRPTIHVDAIIATRRIEETFTPELKISFITGGEKGNIIEISELVHSKLGEVTENSQIYVDLVEDHRNVSYVAFFVTSIVLVKSLYEYNKLRPEITSSMKTEKLMSEYKDLITESTQEPPDTRIRIDIETLDDLAKTSQILARPIIHHSGLFYIIDGDTMYKYQSVAEDDEKS